MFTRIYWLVLFLAPATLIAQGEIQGQVKDANAGQPLAYATVLLLSASDSSQLQGTVTREGGAFTVDCTTDAPVLVRVQMMGYATYDSPVFSVKADERKVLETVLLRSTAQELDAVTVEGKRSRVQIDMGKRTLYVGSDIASQGESALNALDQLPSVTTDLEGTINIRGESNVVIFINGQETNKDGLSLRNIPASRIKKIRTDYQSFR